MINDGFFDPRRLLLPPVLGFALTTLVPLSDFVQAQQAQVDVVKLAKTSREDSFYRGWDYLARKLIGDGIPKDEVEYVYSNPLMPRFELVTFKLAPKEPADIYRGFLSKEKIKKARYFMATNLGSLTAAEKTYGVPKEVITAILFVETQFGLNTGNQMIINRLSRIANIRDPLNLKANFALLKEEDPRVTFEQVDSRADYLEKTFYPEIKAIFEISRRKKIDPFHIKGSSAGAFGLPQFLPSSFLKYAVDGNQNGETSLFEKRDAIFSVGNYLSNYGWKPGVSEKEKRQAIWGYNKSEPYINTVLKIAQLLSVK
jgi:membrane-bound lytic murein transglycosylase B